MSPLIWNLMGGLQAVITCIISWLYPVQICSGFTEYAFFFFYFVLQALFFDFLLLLENVQGKCLRRSLSFCLFVEFIFSFRICFTGAVEMSRKSPFASWLCAMLHCFGSYILADLLLGEAPIHYFSNNSSVILATAIWWVLCASSPLPSIRHCWLCTKTLYERRYSVCVTHVLSCLDEPGKVEVVWSSLRVFCISRSSFQFLWPAV